MALSGKKVYGALKGEIDSISQKLDDAIVGIFTPGGSLEFEDLPELSADVLGFVYEIMNDFTTTSDFVEGEGIDYPAGTKVAVVNRGTEQSPEYMFDVTTGAIEVDSELSLTSKNPVQNKVITEALNGIAIPDEISSAEAQADFEAVFGNDVTVNPNLLTASATVFDSSDVTIVDP